jgi:nucleoside-diphosphate-sugar epimerase
MEGGAIGGPWRLCDVRDVARAHVLAAETPGASGRYIVSHRCRLVGAAALQSVRRFLCVCSSELPPRPPHDSLSGFFGAS